MLFVVVVVAVVVVFVFVVVVGFVVLLCTCTHNVSHSSACLRKKVWCNANWQQITSANSRENAYQLRIPGQVFEHCLKPRIPRQNRPGLS